MICPMAPPISDSRRLLDEVGSGDPKRALEAIRDRLIVEFDQAPSRYVAALARVLIDVLKDLQRLPSGKRERTLEDELRDRREMRLTTRGEVPAQRNGGRTKEAYPRRSGGRSGRREGTYTVRLRRLHCGHCDRSACVGR
jgi:hypothetical protein